MAGRQGGVVSRDQLRAAGWSPAKIDAWVRDGRLHVLHRGVYALGHRAVTPRGHLLAAVFAGGPGAVASHRSAAQLWGIRPHNGRRHDVTTRTHRSAKAIAFHRCALAPEDVTKRDGVPCTTVARTLLDLADVLPADHLARAAHEAEVRRVYDQRQLDDVLARAAGRRGVKVLAEITRTPLPPSRSELARRFLRLVDAAGLPRPVPETEELGPEVDALWPEHRVAVELDGAATHVTRKRFESDRRRDAELTARGWRVLRFTWRQVTEDRDHVVRVLAACLR